MFFLVASVACMEGSEGMLAVSACRSKIVIFGDQKHGTSVLNPEKGAPGNFRRGFQVHQVVSRN